jgi:hypothetical protein
MEDVFPGCLQNKAFMNAVLYSIMQNKHKGVETPTALRLKGSTLRHLRQLPLSQSGKPTRADVGAMLILRGVTYQWEDLSEYETHTAGLAAIQTSCGEATCLTEMANRAAFWQRLTACHVFEKPWQPLSTVDWFWYNSWSTEFCKPRQYAYLPQGFSRHADILPVELLGKPISCEILLMSC